MTGQITIGVSAEFTAAHWCLEGRMHWHTWSVLAWFDVPARTDAREKRDLVDSLLSNWDRAPLPAELDWSEDIAAAVGRLPDCVEVVVSRGDQRIYARWRAR